MYASFSKRNIFAKSLLLPISLMLLANPLLADHIPDWMRQAASESVTFDKEAVAGVLLDEQTFKVQPNGEVETTHRRVVKILRLQGRENAVLGASFSKDSKIRSIKAWSLGSHGEEYELKEKDFTESGYTEALYDDVHVKYVRAPAADPGAVVGVEYEKKERPYFPQENWHFQEDIPVHLARYILQLPAGWEYKTSFFQHAPIEPVSGGGNTFVWEVHDIPGIKEQPSMPPERSILGRMALAYFGGDQPVDLGSWALIGRWYARLSDDRRNDSPEIGEKSRQLTAGLTSTFDKAAALAAYMQGHIRYVEISIGIGGYQPHFATDVFHNGYGDCKDKATLLSSMLHDVGISSQLVLVNTERGAVAPDVPSTYFDHAVLAVRWPDQEALDPRIHALVTDKTGARWILFDPTNSYTPFGQVDQWLEKNYVLLSADTGGELVQLPLNKPEWNQSTRTGHLKLGEDGTLAGEVEETITGDQATRSRFRLVSESEAERRKYADNFLGSFLSGFVLEDFKIDNLNQNDKPLLIHYKFTAHNYARHAGSLLLVRPRVLGEQILPLDQEPRKYPVNYPFTAHETDNFTIELPSGYTIDELPDPASADMGFAAFHSKAEYHDGVLSYQDDYTVRDVLVSADHVDEVRRLNGVIVTDQRSVAVLKRTQ